MLEQWNSPQVSGSWVLRAYRTSWGALQNTSPSGPTPRGSVSVHLGWGLRIEVFLKDSCVILMGKLLYNVGMSPFTDFFHAFIPSALRNLLKERTNSNGTLSVQSTITALLHITPTPTTHTHSESLSSSCTHTVISFISTVLHRSAGDHYHAGLFYSLRVI